jgi:hypothetical protein
MLVGVNFHGLEEFGGKLLKMSESVGEARREIPLEFLHLPQCPTLKHGISG